MTIKELEPKLIWGIFDEITNVPRPSKKEGKIREYLLEFAKKHNIDAKTDGVGNVAMRVPATPGKENVPTIVMQGHMDMVPNQTKPETHNFDTDPILTEIDGEWVHSAGYKTTLGADNGIGMAAALAALIDPSFVHGPLEALFTVDEETGLTGAKNLGKDMITGETLINLDSEDEAQIFLGCAGGIDTIGKFPYTCEQAPEGYQFFTFSIMAFKGGHSGADIHLGRANANKLLARFLFECYQAYGHIAIADINGGELRNVIPGNAYAVIGVPADRKEDLRTRANLFAATVEEEYKGIEDAQKITLESADAPQCVIDGNTAKRVVMCIHSAQCRNRDEPQHQGHGQHIDQSGADSHAPRKERDCHHHIAEKRGGIKEIRHRKPDLRAFRTLGCHHRARRRLSRLDSEHGFRDSESSGQGLRRPLRHHSGLHFAPCRIGMR